ncbi:MAG: adenylate/guanylate cyclase domain-containing protein, partial [Rhodospirillaceae bacterium]|nr:adenylate/guanylate cyclase domain-containing protein [Rhodospirillaceae bacterium]
MAQGELIRRLAAIVVADIAGYSRLMEGDEAGTLARLQQLREEIIDPKMAEYRGRIVKTMGDGMLVEFASVTDALKSCVEMQEALRDRNVNIPADSRIEFRVGVNLGEIIIEGADIYGTGVNVAARLETLAEPGGIRISGSVHDQIRTILSLDYEDMGEQTVKNILAPVRSYAVRSAVPVSDSEPIPTPALAPQAAKSEKPAIAVLPFENLSGDPEQEYFADGVTEDLITTLSQIGQLSVVSRNSAFTFKNRAISAHDAGGELNARYVVTGSLRKSGNRIRVTVQLTDTETEEHLWSNRYDRGLEDVFAVQDEITLTIATALQVELTEGEQAKLRYTTTGNVAAWTLFIRGLSLFRTVSADTYRHARECFEQALAEDPDSAQIRAMLACVHAIEGRFHWTPDRDESLRMAKELADQALAIDEGNADGWAALGYWHMSYLRLDDSVAAYARAVDSAPDH